MDKAQSDLIVWYRLETEIFPGHVRHTKYLAKAKNRGEKVMEDWANCGELGRGGFGVVNKQIEETTGHYRAVKTIDKRLHPKVHYSRELLVLAILAKHPSLFVEFLGWFEEPEALHIAMEYFEQGDLTKHIGTPLPQETVQSISKQILEGLQVMHQQGIAHRDLKPANIFVVSMSPVWVKLGDFGVSKRILAQATTTFHTQVSTQVYGAPEVLGLDSNSETSNYTNSVDIWSLGCMIFELLVGTKLFITEGQVSRYYFGKWPFPKDKLTGLSPPTSDFGISLLESMLVIQPEDRPTAAAALRNPWLTGVKSEGEESEDDKDEITLSRKRKNRRAAYNEPKRRSERIFIKQEGARCILGGGSLGENPGSQMGDCPTIAESTLGTSMITQLVSASTGSLVVQATHSKTRGPVRQNQAYHQSKAQATPQGQTLTVEIVPNPPPKQITQQNASQRKRPKTTPPLSMKLRPRLPTGEPTQPRTRGSAPTVRTIQRTKPHTPRRGGCTNRSRAAINLIQNPNAKRNLNSRRDLAMPVPNTDHNPDQNPNASLNHNTGGSRNPGRNTNRQRPNAGQAKETTQALEVEQ